ncbi:MAG: hypothetical protein HXS41_01920 [Theionarchaea archaeon]|nr:hypothetical protein [Theionarchaea archaeon]
MGVMGQKKLRDFYKVYQQISAIPGVPIYKIADITKISRNTVSKYLMEMYRDTILIGPQIRMLPSPNYREYIYLLNFKNPFHFYQHVRGFPHILYHAMTFGDWNTMVITDRPIDVSHLVGYEETVFQGVRYHSYTPRTQHISWPKGIAECSARISRFTPHVEKKNRSLAPVLEWGEDQWKTYYAFKDNTRKTATTTLNKIGVRYETYVKWIENLETHCSVLTGFYPQGYQTYLTYCFFICTDYEQAVREIFSHLPTTPFIMEVGKNLMVFISVTLSGIKRKLFCLIYDMKTQGIIEDVSHAALIFQATSEFMPQMNHLSIPHI